MFITAVCVIFLIKLRWPKNKSLYNLLQFSTRGWSRTLDVTKPQEKRIASPPTNFKDKHEVDFLFSALIEDLSSQYNQ